MGVAVKYYNETQSFCTISWTTGIYDGSFKFFFPIAELKNTHQQEIPSNSIEILVPHLQFDEVNDTILQNLLPKRIDKDIVWAIAGGLPDKEKRMPLLGSWTSFLKKLP